MAILHLAWRSLLNRRATALLTLFAIALSVALLIGVERLRSDARAGFANTLSGTDLIVGARSSPVQLLLYAVFRIGDATNNISWKSYQKIAENKRIAWSVPISLGDSHRGFRVVGTTPGFFEHYHYARQQALVFAAGEPFSDLYDAVIGAQVARDLSYKLGDELVLAHGASDVSFARHDNKPFRVVGILRPTGTPVDRSVHVSLQGIEAIHADWRNGAPVPGVSLTAQQARAMDLTPKNITAVLIGLQSKGATFRVQRAINDFKDEPLTAILPGAALSQLWGLVGVAENALLIVSVFVVVVGLFGMLVALLTSLNERRREMAILRSLGARPGHIFALIMGEAVFLTLLGAAVGLALLYLLVLIAQPIVEQQFGIYLALGAPSGYEWQLLGGVVVAGLVAGSIPSYRAYRLSLSDGLSQRL